MQRKTHCNGSFDDGHSVISSHGKKTRVPQTFRKLGWREIAGQCVRMHAVQYACSPVDCSGSVRQPCAALLPLTAVSPLPLNVSRVIAL